jgi:DNA-binding beta-propeller fold protein YncE
VNLVKTSLKWMAVGAAMVSSTQLFAQQAPSFVAFESAPVRPIAQMGNKLYVTNTPDNTLEVFNIGANGKLSPAASISVGMEPVAVAVRNANEVWVVNHLSDSVSIVNTAASEPHVKRTLLVGDEPRDIVFAQGKAFVTTAHRGQHREHASIQNVDGAGGPDTHTPSVGRSDVWVFDTANLSNALGGRPTKILSMYGDTPRALEVSADGNTVYTAVFNSGNQTSVVHQSVMCLGFEDTPAGFPYDGTQGTGENRNGNQPCVAGNIPRRDATASPNGMSRKRLPKGRPLPSTDASGEQQPWEGMIVKYNNETGKWEDSRGLNYSNAIRFNLPDHDVFAVNANTLEQVADYEHVGTTLFNMAVNPVNGKIYVSNTDGQNHIRFEGPGVRGGSTTQGNIAHAQITVIDPANESVKPRHLNRHIDYSVLKADPETKKHSVSTPMQMAVSSDGSTLYVAAVGSDKVAVYSTAELESDGLWDGQGNEFDPTQASAYHIDVDGGPMGLLLDENANGDNGQLYVLTRFDNSVKVIDASTGAERQEVAMYNPEPEHVIAGRFMLYDANRTSSNGESSCASCHVFGDMDHLTWNLGNPDGSNQVNTNPFFGEHLADLDCDYDQNSPGCYFFRPLINGNGDLRTIAAQKGPMNTQTMRGMSTMGHMHWRGDRVTGYFGTEVDADGNGDPDTGDHEMLDEKLSFKNFIVAFEGLLGMEVDLDGGVNAANKSAKRVALENDVDKFADFMLSVQLQPNPLRKLDNGMSESAQRGAAFFHGNRRSDGAAEDYPQNGPQADGVNCEGCHTVDIAKGFFGGDGTVSTGGEMQILKTPHFRNLYQRVGMFGLPSRNGFRPSITDDHQGDQVRGFGFLHDGATDMLFNFLGGGVFDNGQLTCAQEGLPNWAGCDFNDGRIGIPNDTVRLGLADYVLEFDSDMAPIVGQQITLNKSANNARKNRVKLLEQRAGTGFTSKILGGQVTECDLVAKGVVAGEQRGYLFNPDNDSYSPDRGNEANLPKGDLKAMAQQEGNALTFTCVPAGSGYRIALDRDEDGQLNGDDA